MAICLAASPSWPWICVNGATTIPITYSIEQGCQIQVIDSRVEPVRSIAPYGAVSSGYLKLRGRIKPAVWTKPSISRLYSEGTLRERKAEAWTGNEPSVIIESDALEDEFVEGDVDSLPVALFEVWHSPYDSDYRPKGHANLEICFQRLGVFRFMIGCIYSRQFDKRDDKAQFLASSETLA